MLLAPIRGDVLGSLSLYNLQAVFPLGSQPFAALDCFATPVALIEAPLLSYAHSVHVS